MKLENTDNETPAKAYLEFLDSYGRMSRPEQLFNNEGYMLLQEHVSARVAVLVYEPLSFNLPGGKYTPDFQVICDDGQIAFVEVKQQSVSRSGRKYYAGRASYRDSRSKLRAAAELNPWFKFFQASYNTRSGWTIEPIVPSKEIGGRVSLKSKPPQSTSPAKKKVSRRRNSSE